jgi:phage terminase small subunit
MGTKRELRDERFAREYVIDLNGEQAAIRAGYAPKSAKVTASRLLTKANIKARIAELAKQHADKLNLKAEQVLRELCLMGFSNMMDYIKVNAEGDAFIDLSALTRDQTAAIQEITVEETGEGKGKDRREVTRTKLKLADKREALELLGRHLKLFDQAGQAGADDQVILVDIPRPGFPNGRPLPTAPNPQLPSPETQS